MRGGNRATTKSLIKIHSMETQTFILELPVKVDDSEARTILRKFEYARQLYNAVLGSALGRLQQMRQDTRWKEARAMPKGKERNDLFKTLVRQYRLSEYDLHATIAQHRSGSGRKSELGINEAQKIASRVYQSVHRYQLGSGGRPRFKSASRGLQSIEGKTNTTGLKFKAEQSVLDWCRHHYRVMVAPSDNYIQHALRKDGSKEFKRIKYCRLKRKIIKGRQRFFLDLIIEGVPPFKHAYAPTTERLSIDPGPQEIAVFSDRFVGKINVAPTAHIDEAKIRRIQRSMDRSLRQNNAAAYQANGTLLKGTKLTKTKNYQKRANKLRECHRVAAATRRCEHGKVINLLLSLAGDIRVEKNSWKAFQKGHFGKSLGKSGIAGFIEQLKSKAESASSKVVEVNPYRLKLSQYDPYTNSYAKKSLAQRWHRFGDTDEWIQRDILSALLLQCADIDLEKHNLPKIKKTLEGAKQLLRDAGYVISKPSSNGNHCDCAFAPEPQALTSEKVRLEILCGANNGHLPLFLRECSQKEADEKVSIWSKETFPLQRGVV